MRWLGQATAALTLLAAGVVADGTAYKKGEEVVVFVNTVGPFYNPSETYPYYRLPVCAPDTIETASSLGGNLEGDKLANSMYTIKFLENAEKKPLCSLKLKPKDIEQLREAIEELYYFEFVLDDLPVSNFLGVLDEKKDVYPHTHDVLLWTHHHFFIHYNKDQVIFANVSVETPVLLPETDKNSLAVKEIPFTYSVTWLPTDVEWEDRTKSHGSLQVHWLSITNSIVLVILMTGFVALILMRVLRSDFARYSRDEEEAEGLQDDYGWKLINGDVFRFPPNRDMLCAILGVGSQFLAVAVSLCLMAICGVFHDNQHGLINSSSVMLYAFTSSVAGYVSSTMYRQLGGEKWVRNIIITSLAFVAPLFIIWSVLNSIAWGYASTQALPAGTVIQLMFLWLLVGFPLTVIGGIVGKNTAKPFDAPCRTKVIPREIPIYPWYRSKLVHMLFGGFLPFSAISIELYYVFLTLWGRHLYTLYGILSLVFLILLVVTACVAITLTYFQLSMEDYRWWWPAVTNVGSTGLFIFAYSIFYFNYRSNMSGSLQSGNYFGYTLVLCYITFCMLGTVGFFSSMKFVRYIYSTIKTD
eukprot:comp23328_c0_seq1/m.38424 comp23328_c0_seq1/g.38424  ORF comp23328_c0_seq1/g.38424 comp23328_c0_seq1/m.38424 type:complete len:583 (-) comp23328_c0_seq1:469-2217(-)